MDKKGIAPIVATVLLIMLVVITFLTVRSYYLSEQSELSAGFQNENSQKKTYIDDLDGQNLYFYSGYGNLSVITITYEGNVCNNPGYFVKGLNVFDIGSSCISGVSGIASPSLVIVTDEGSFEKTFYNPN